MDSTCISILIHGDPKIGKTFLGSTTKRPVLFLDVEAGGVRFVPGRKVFWTDLNSAPPVYNEDWDICVVPISSFQDFENAKAWIVSGHLEFKSIVIDSLTELQAKTKLTFSQTGTMRIQDWGALLFMLEKAIEEIRDAGLQFGLETVVFIAGSDTRDNQRTPMLQGQIARRIAYKIDVCGYLSVVEDENGVPRRLLQVVPTRDTIAGNRLGGFLDDYLVDPHLETIVSEVNQKIFSPIKE